MAIHRGIQSVVFFYLSCAPCTERGYRKRRKEEAKLARAEREALEAELPDVYRHPSPSSTNPHWQTEIALGPSLLTRAGKRKPPSQVDLQRSAKGASRLSSSTSHVTSSVDLPERLGSEDGSDERWNYKLHQRQNEALGGSSSNVDGSQYGESIRRPPTARTKDSARSNFQSFRNPPVNDLHPAIVTRVTSREEVMWMMQPPPVADVMAGLVQASRSRSDSANSRFATANGVPLSKTLGRNMLDQTRSASNVSQSSGQSRQSSIRTAEGPTGQPHDRGNGTRERDFAPGNVSPDIRPKRRPSPIITSDSSEDLAPRPVSAQYRSRRASARTIASRPQLSSIASDSLVPTLDDAVGFHQPSVGHPPPRTPIDRTPVDTPHHDDELFRARDFSVDQRPFKFIPDLTPGSTTILNTHILTTSSTPKDRRSSHHHHSHDDSSADDAAMLAQFRPELFDTWYTDNAELPQWIHEHTKRDVQQRWSMDL